MQQASFIVREPLLNAQERVLGYHLTWQPNDTIGTVLNEAEAKSLARFVSEQINGTDPESNSLLGGHVLFMPAHPALLTTDIYSQLPREGIVLSLSAADLADPATVAAATALRSEGFGISLREANLATIDKSLLNVVTHVEVSVNASDFATQVQTFRALDISSARIVVRNVTTWQQYDFCALLGMDAFVGKLHLTPRRGIRSKDLNPSQAMILQLMDLVRRNADPKQLESVLKRDAALSFKLLRYINSAGFALGCEVQSLKHAVSMLGYSPLFRWLGLLLATASTTGYSPVLMQTAVIRGRFAELLAHTFLPKSEAENLFVTGMFSLLDRLLGIPMEEVLQKVQLSDEVTEALLSRTGIYGPFLALAEACELRTADVEEMATSLCINPRQVNQAHLAALAWAQSLKL
jgi:EAL and modified HD-GYP domain-containing signal transduction protein